MKSYRQTLVPKALGIIRVRVRVTVRVRRLEIFPGERNFPVNQLKIFVPRGMKFLGRSVENFRSPGNEISWWIS